MSHLILKLIACGSMLIDHFASCLFDVSGKVMMTDGLNQLYYALRGIGRIAFPIFCFLLVEGAKHTRSKWRYAARLALFALISEIPFNLALRGTFFQLNGFRTVFQQPSRLLEPVSAVLQCFRGTSQNVYFTLFFGLLAVYYLQWAGGLSGGKRVAGLVFAPITVAVLGGFAAVLHTDYGMGGVIQIALMGILLLPVDEVRPGLSVSPGFRSIVVTLAILALCLIESNEFELLALLSVPFIAVYNGKLGLRNAFVKWAGYSFYPLHLTVLALIYVVPKLMRWG